MTHSVVAAAVDAFEAVQRTSVLLAKKEASMSYWALQMATDPTITPEDKAQYVELTNALMHKYDEKIGKVKVGP